MFRQAGRQADREADSSIPVMERKWKKKWTPTGLEPTTLSFIYADALPTELKSPANRQSR